MLDHQTAALYKQGYSTYEGLGLAAAARRPGQPLLLCVFIMCVRFSVGNSDTQSTQNWTGSSCSTSRSVSHMFIFSFCGFIVVGLFLFMPSIILPFLLLLPFINGLYSDPGPLGSSYEPSPFRFAYYRFIAPRAPTRSSYVELCLTTLHCYGAPE